MSEVVNNQGTSTEIEKPVQVNDDVKFPPFPEPTEEEFEDDIGDDERVYYKQKFADLSLVNSMKLHCTACDRHLGSSTRNESRIRVHPMLRTLMCHTCHTFYNSGEFEKGDDGSELYCRWCGQGGQVYCCSDCPHVFCAKCIKRNFGLPKIKEIETTDDWKCFKCNSRCLWDLRALCWALLRYCDFKNKITHKTEDLKLKEAYQKDCAVDHSECCKHKTKRKEKSDLRSAKKDNIEAAKKINSVIARVPATIQVKKFASIVDESPKEKKAHKRPGSPIKTKPLLIKNPMAVVQNQNIPIAIPTFKKIRMPILTNPIRVNTDHIKTKNTYIAQNSYTRIRPRPPAMPVIQTPFNGFPTNNSYNNSYNPMVINDNINLSLESLTQGLDMAAVAAMTNNRSNQDDDVVCTPDFPLEPLCEVTEDNTDDDVQCITPAPATKQSQPQQIQQNTTNSTAFITRVTNNLPDVTSDNIIQMTSEDVSVNTVTGGLKFRVDPQTLSSNKMYRLPDGRIFAINANPNMPGGYSATIVAVTESTGKPVAPKGATYAAKLSAIPSSTSKSKQSVVSNNNTRSPRPKANILKKAANLSKSSSSSSKEIDMNTPVEWYRFNLLEAIDCLEYSLGRLERLKKQATTSFLRRRSVEDIINLQRTLERVLNTSTYRFNEIRDNLNKELKQFLFKKSGRDVSDDDDDDVEILPDLNDDPIFIDENSTESTVNEINNEKQEVDLTCVGSSDQNDSTEHNDDSELNNTHKDDTNAVNVKDISVEDVYNDENDTYSANIVNTQMETKNIADSRGEDNSKDVDDVNTNSAIENNCAEENSQIQESSEANDGTVKPEISDTSENDKEHMDARIKEKEDRTEDASMTEQTENNVKQESNNDASDKIISETKHETPEDNSSTRNCDKIQDTEMNEDIIDNIIKEEEKFEPDLSEEMIENLLKDDSVDENIINNKAMDVV